MQQTLLVTADDRTGALEIGGALARKGNPMLVCTEIGKVTQSVIDISSRHLSPEEAFEKMHLAHDRDVEIRMHKMDSGLRGNWPYEVHALLDLGFEIAVIPSFPDAGRRCEQGVVYIDDVPLLQSPFGADPLTAPCSSRPIEVLEEAGCALPGIEIWDANTNDELAHQVLRCRREQRILVGPTGAIDMYARTLLKSDRNDDLMLRKPILIVCGSLNSVSREQLNHFEFTKISPAGPFREFGSVGVLTTPAPILPITLHDAREMALRIAEAVEKLQRFASTLLVIGGDTVAAVLGSRQVSVLGTIGPGIPVARIGRKLVVTKGGGIGHRATLVNIVQNAQE
ncbi:MAG: hypothetical protein OXG08_09250 [Gammaproteobacteria bacterium]|nr:hypothetical protein [Gammaproteobacteria bacterium]